ncbi:uncharacterized protein [Typha angustifolia]|uniref:uncharacterized protein n=1 Tax=Typha angustifolia TaxID=59011 RepID=UPI003C2D418E
MAMDDMWSWITTLPVTPANFPSSLLLASSEEKSILLQVDRTAGSDSEALVTFSVLLHGFFHPCNQTRTLWVSNPCPLSSPSSSHLQLLTQLIRELISLSPSTSHSYADLDFSCIKLELPEPILDSPAFFSLALLLRLFWLCAVDAPSDAGFLFFSKLGPTIERAVNCCGKDMGDFLRAVGPDVEERFVRSLGYVLAKWCLLREIHEGPKVIFKPMGSAYVKDSHGLWVLKGYAPVQAMNRLRSCPVHEAGESALHYALAHQQLEVVVQLEYYVSMRDPRFIRVGVRVDNLRVHVVRLGFGKDGEDSEEDVADVVGERHFPSRVRFWVGPEPGSSYASGPTLGRSTGNPERELETIRTVKGRLGGGAKAAVKAKARSAARSTSRSWRWEQEADGGAGVFEGVLCDSATGAEVATWRVGSGGRDPRVGMRRRWGGPGRAFSKKGGLVVAGDEVAEEVTWRVGRGMEGRRVRWRIGGTFWVSYCANEVKSDYFETRWVEWRDEVDLVLVATGGDFGL